MIFCSWVGIEPKNVADNEKSANQVKKFWWW